MIIKDRKSAIAIFWNKKTITAVYKGHRIICEFILSCFGKGYWVNTSAWINTDSWKNNI